MSRPRVAAGLAALALSGLGVLGLQAPALAVCGTGPGYNPNDCGTAPGNSGQHVQHGQQMACTGDHYKPKTHGVCTFHSKVVFAGDFVANDAGVISGLVTVPDALSAGKHELVLSGIGINGKPRTTTVAFTVVKAGAGSGNGSSAGNGNNAGGVGGVQLPRTGAEIAAFSLVGIALIGAGGVAVASGRRRRVAA